jgi:hypothetical protein
MRKTFSPSEPNRAVCAPVALHILCTPAHPAPCSTVIEVTARPTAIGFRSSRRASGAATLALAWIAAIARRRRDARAAAWLDGQPAYLLDDIGIDRSCIASLRRGQRSELADWPRGRD